MKKYSIMLLALACSACSSLSKQSSKNFRKTSDQVQQNEQQFSTTKTTKVLLDTSSAALEVAFWPKGLVKYSPTTGFEGEVHQIKLRSKQQQSSLLKENKEQHLSSNKEIVFKQEEQNKAKTNLKDKKQHYFWLFGFLLMLGVSIGIFCLLYKRKLVWVKS